jgi:hypothetical protein
LLSISVGYRKLKKGLGWHPDVQATLMACGSLDAVLSSSQPLLPYEDLPCRHVVTGSGNGMPLDSLGGGLARGEAIEHAVDDPVWRP